MVLKVHLIKPKNKHTPTFYKTSQIKFQSLSIPQQNRFRTRSTPKIIRYNNPWQLMTKQEINSLAQRLQDKPQQLYEVVKQNQRQKSQQQQQSRRLKFNKLQYTSIQQHHTSSTNSLTKYHMLNNNIKKPYIQFNSSKINNNKKLTRYFSQSSLNLSNQQSKININNQYNKLNLTDHHHSSILQKINIKKLQYEKQMKQIIQNKRLLLQTDLPKISKIKMLDGPKQKLRLSNNSMDVNNNGSVNKKSGKLLLPVWKMR